MIAQRKNSSFLITHHMNAMLSETLKKYPELDTCIPLLSLVLNNVDVRNMYDRFAFGTSNAVVVERILKMPPDRVDSLLNGWLASLQADERIDVHAETHEMLYGIVCVYALCKGSGEVTAHDRLRAFISDVLRRKP